jgi:hypothetical protein
MSCNAASTVRFSACQRRTSASDRPRFCVDGVEGLIQHDQPRVLRQYPREQHAASAAGQRANAAVLKTVEADGGGACAILSQLICPCRQSVERQSPVPTRSNTEIGKLRSMSTVCGR